MKVKIKNKSTFSDNLSSYQGDLFHRSNISRQPVALSDELVLSERFSQTRSLGGKDPLDYFFKQSLIKLWQLDALEAIPQTSCLSPEN